MQESISMIKERFNACMIEEVPALTSMYSKDERKGVIQVVNSWKRKHEEYTAEIERVSKMFEYENIYYNKGISLIAGIDEVGRGPLAGPVVCAAVILPKGMIINGVNDSKKLSEKKRNELFKEINEKAVAVSIGIESNNTIDEINILQATIKAMEKAVLNLSVEPEHLLIDAVKLNNIKINQDSIIKGDEKSISIAAASIIAKVTRDKMMEEMHEVYPEYGFKDNKGYGSNAHIEAIKKFGLCPIHRKSFTSRF